MLTRGEARRLMAAADGGSGAEAAMMRASASAVGQSGGSGKGGGQDGCGGDGCAERAEPATAATFAASWRMLGKA